MSSDTAEGNASLDPRTVRLIHDIRNSLASMRAAASMLERSGTNANVVAKVADGINREVAQIIARIDEFVGRPVTPAEPGANAPTAAPAAPLSILIADDNADSANALSLYLRMQGHHVTVAFDGTEALRLATLDQPKVMLLDLSMPGLDGYELARRIRSQDWGSGARLIAVSGWMSQEDLARASAAGYDAHVNKPIDMDRLETLLQPAV